MLMTRLSVLLVLLTLGCDDASTALVSVDAAMIADAATDAMVDDGDAGSPRDVALPEDGSADGGADIPDGQPPAPDSATADRGVADVLNLTQRVHPQHLWTPVAMTSRWSAGSSNRRFPPWNRVRRAILTRVWMGRIR